MNELIYTYEFRYSRVGEVVRVVVATHYYLRGPHGGTGGSRTMGYMSWVDRAFGVS